MKIFIAVGLLPADNRTPVTCLGREQTVFAGKFALKSSVIKKNTSPARSWNYKL